VLFLKIGSLWYTYLNVLLCIQLNDQNNNNLEAQNIQMNKLIQLESEYVDIISHEIKNPLTIINGNLSHLDMYLI